MQPSKPIRNEADYELALQEIDRCLDAASGRPERDQLEVLPVLVGDYEAKHHPITPSPHLSPSPRLNLYWSREVCREKI